MEVDQREMLSVAACTDERFVVHDSMMFFCCCLFIRSYVLFNSVALYGRNCLMPTGAVVEENIWGTMSPKRIRRRWEN